MAIKRISINARVDEKQYELVKQLAEELNETISSTFRIIIDEFFTMGLDENIKEELK